MSNEQNLTPFKKGQSGNPKGMKKGTKHRSTILKELLALTDDDGEITEVKLEQSIILKALAGDVAAYKEIKDSMYGKLTDTSFNVNAETEADDVPKGKMKAVAKKIAEELVGKY